jgi:hypothetical protein
MRRPPVKPPQRDHPTDPDALQAGGEPGPVVSPPGGEVLVNTIGRNAGSDEGVALRRQGLAAVTPRHAHIADPHGGTPGVRKAIGEGATLR